VHYYRLQALEPRVIEATIVADTDQGWFTWSQQAVQLTLTTYTTTTKSLKMVWKMADSPDLSVTFPEPVNVRRAWITSARTHGDPYFGWDTRGVVTCAPPDFVALYARGPGKTERTPQPGDPTPAPATSGAFAVATTAPFPMTTCDHPFTLATVSSAVQPVVPQILRNEGFNEAVSEIAVAVDPSGKLADAWVFSSSGYPQLDQSALDAARRSKYVAPVSYCSAVGGMYLFRANFQPY
jgi:TonB family protein